MPRRGPPQRSILAEPRVTELDKGELEGLSRSQRRLALSQQRSLFLARDVVRAGNEMWAGGRVPPWERRIAGNVDSSGEVGRIVDACRDFDQRTAAFRDSVPIGHQALSVLARIPPGGYSGLSGSIPSAKCASVERGDIVPAIVDAIDLPSVSGKCTLRYEQLEKLSAELPSGNASDLLLPLWEADHEVGYADPKLRSGAMLDELAVMLAMCGLCVPTNRAVPVGVKLFCVAKNGDVGAPKSQRLIWDCRAVSAMCRPPPRTEMGSIGALVDVELGSPSQGSFFGLCCSDLACFFYSLKGIIPGLERLCVLEGVNITNVKRRLEELSKMTGRWVTKEKNGELCAKFGKDYAARALSILADWPEGASDLGCVAPPMGWSWSPFVAQQASSFLAREACPCSLHVVHKGENRVMKGSAIMTYLDDIGGITRGRSELDAVAGAEKLLCTLKAKAEEYGLETHKDQVGREVTELGVQLRATHGTVIATPSPKKLLLLMRATRFVATRRSIQKQAFLCVLGHWAWMLQLQRSQYAVLDECYRATVTSAAYVHISARVKQELVWLVKLAPMLRADLGSQLCRTMYMVDAGPEGGAVVSTLLTQGEQYSSEVELGAYPRAVWRLGATGTWSRQEHNNLCEARTNLWALERAGRDEARSARKAGRPSLPRRVIVYTDSLVTKGAFAKGRSSSRSLNRLCRKHTALCVLFGVVGIFRYVASAENWADGPSRGLRYPCVHRETEAKAEQKRARQRVHADASGLVRSGAAGSAGSWKHTSVDGSVSDGRFHWQKSKFGDRINARRWITPEVSRRQPMWRVDREAARAAAAEVCLDEGSKSDRVVRQHARVGSKPRKKSREERARKLQHG